MEKATEELKRRGWGQRGSNAVYMAFRWEHINFLGEYKFEGLHSTSLHSLRSLNNKKQNYS